MHRLAATRAQTQVATRKMRGFTEYEHLAAHQELCFNIYERWKAHVFRVCSRGVGCNGCAQMKRSGQS